MDDMKSYNSTFSKAYKFMESHLNANSFEDWHSLAKEAGEIFKEPFESAMGHAVVDEIKRRQDIRRTEEGN